MRGGGVPVLGRCARQVGLHGRCCGAVVLVLAGFAGGIAEEAREAGCRAQAAVLEAAGAGKKVRISAGADHGAGAGGGVDLNLEKSELLDCKCWLAGWLRLRLRSWAIGLLEGAAAQRRRGAGRCPCPRCAQACFASQLRRVALWMA